MKRTIGVFLVIVVVLSIAWVVMCHHDQALLSGNGLAVKIVSPPDGTTFTLHEDEAVANIKVLVGGDPTDGPYQLILRDAQLHSIVVRNVAVGSAEDFVFHLSVPGTGWFTAYVEDEKGNHATDSVAYSVSASK